MPRPWALLADQDDLLGLPRALDRWGRQVGCGATLELGGQHVVLLAPSAGGYARLCRLLSWRREDADGWRAWSEGRAQGPDLTHLVCLVVDEDWGRRLERLGAEVMRRAGLRPWQQPSAFPILAAPLLRHIDDHDRLASPVLEAIRGRATVRAGAPAGAALSDLPGMRAAYRGYEEQLEAGTALLQRCRHRPGGGPLHLPPPLPQVHADDPATRLAEEASAGMHRRYGADPAPAVRDRLAHELQVIADKHFASYVLTVWDLARGRRTCGRGSAASSIICYCLGLTNVDPIRYRLVFERFLAPERTDPPDIDIDFPWDERDGVIAETIHRYGWEHVAMVATHQTMHHAAAMREAARAYGLPDAAITQVRDRLRAQERYGTPLGEDMPAPWPLVLATAEAIAGAPRHLGVHCGGVVVSGTPIREIAVVHPAAKTVALDGGEGGQEALPVPTVSWEKDGCEDLGLVKIDILSNRSLAVIRDCLADLHEDGVAIIEERWRPEDDPATRALVASGGTMGCFYIESPAMRQLQAKVGSGDFDRLVVHSSIIRPAANAWIATYIARYHRWRESGGAITADEEAEWYPHPALKGLLSESFGVLSYQEDVMLVAQVLAGFGSREANLLRKALGRADTPDRLRGLVGAFHDGCRANGVCERVIELVWGMISSFAGYSFCKAHSASYAMVSFQCAYLKAHHPAHFLARVIANEGGFYDAAAYVEEARRLGCTVHSPCVLASGWRTCRDGPRSLRLGLHLVRGLSRASADALARERRSRPFAGLRDLRTRCRLAGNQLRALDDAGALDALLAHANASQRSFLVACVAREVEAFIAPASRHGQQLLELLARDEQDPPLPALRDQTPLQQRQRRFAALGLVPEAHPLSLWPLPRRTLTCRDITAALAGRRVVVVAWCITRKQVSATYLRDAEGRTLEQPRFEAMSFVTLEDETGLLETVWFPDAYRRHGLLLERREPLRVGGLVAVEHGCVALTVDRVERVAGCDGDAGAG